MRIRMRGRRIRWVWALMAAVAAVVFVSLRAPLRRTALGSGKVYRIGYGGDVPYHFRDANGLPAGLAVDLVKEAALRRGIALEWKTYEDMGIPAIRRGAADLWVLMTIRPERRGQVHITEPYLVTDTSLLVAEGSGKQSLQDLQHSRVSLIGFDTHLRNLRSILPQSTAVPTTSTRDAIQALEDGRADAALLSQFTAMAGLMSGTGRTPLRILESGLPRSYMGLASSAESAEIADQIRSEMHAMAQDGTLAPLAQRWGFFATLSTDVIGAQEAERERNQRLWWGLVVLCGLLVWIAWQAWRLRGQRNEVSRQKKELRESEERWQLALRGSNDGIWDCELQSGKVYYSARWKEMLGFANDELPNSRSTWERLVHPEDLGWVSDLIEAHLRGESESYSAEYRLGTKTGEYIWVHARGRAVRDEAGRPLRMVGSHTEITERRIFIQELKEAQRLAEAANRAKSQFLMNMSHEIRTPMNAVLGMVELLSRTQSEAERKEYLDLIAVSGRGLVELLTQLLDLSQIESNRLKLVREEFSLRECLRSVEGVYSVVAREKRIGLRVGCDESVADGLVGDRFRLQQVLFNLVGNALKFTERGAVAVEVRRVGGEEDAPELEFAVSDTGIGIPQEKMALVFEAFQQGDNSSTRRHGGSGLGLAISSELVRAMGGELRLESEAGRGSRFYFAAPFGAAGAVEGSSAGLEQTEEAAAEAGGVSLRVLVAEDNLLNQVLIQRLLERDGHVVTIVRDGQSAVESARRNVYDLILMDVQMPVMSGLDAARMIRESVPGGRTIPIYAVSAAVFGCDRSACLEAGMDGFVDKPIEVKSFRRLLAGVARRRRWANDGPPSEAPVHGGGFRGDGDR